MIDVDGADKPPGDERDHGNRHDNHDEVAGNRSGHFTSVGFPVSIDSSIALQPSITMPSK